MSQWTTGRSGGEPPPIRLFEPTRGRASWRVDGGPAGRDDREEPLMGLDELKDKLGGEGVEKVSDAGIEKAGDMVEDKTGGKGAAQIDKGEDLLDAKIGE